VTFERGYQVAAPGQTVDVSGGDYSPQILRYDATKSSSTPVTFQPAPGANVRVAELDFGQTQLSIPAPHGIVVRSMNVTYIRAWDGASNLVWQNIVGMSFAVISANNVSILGGSFGPCRAPEDPVCTPLLVGTSLVLNGVSIHDQTLDPTTNAHVDGMFIRGCQSCAVRNSKFWGNTITNIRVQDCCGEQQTQNLTVENNWFAAPLDGGGGVRADAVDFDTPVPGLLVRYNSFSQSAGPNFGGSWSGTNARLVANLTMNFPCVSGITYSYNLFIPFNPNGWGATPCSSTDRKVPNFGYVSAGGFDYHLAPGSPAVGAGAPGDCPSTDMDGRSRPSPCSAGSEEP
jgi:hypothetical protein